MVEIKVDVISDIVCAWCFIGKRTLEKSIQLYQKTYPGGKNDAFIINWHPYYLNYNPLSYSVEKSELAKTKLEGWSEERIAAMTKRVNQIGAAANINFKSGGKIGNTCDAHRLIHLSKSQSLDVQNTLVENLYKAYHEQEKDISDLTVLHKIAIDAGLAEGEVNELLDSDLYKEVVDDEARQNKIKAITGVPTFFVQSKHRVDGAQEVMELMEAFIKAREAESCTS